MIASLLLCVVAVGAVSIGQQNQPPQGLCEQLIGEHNQWFTFKKIMESLHLKLSSDLKTFSSRNIPEKQEFIDIYSIVFGNWLQCHQLRSSILQTKLPEDFEQKFHYTSLQWFGLKKMFLDSFNDVAPFQSEVEKAKLAQKLDEIVEPLICKSAGCSCCPIDDRSLCAIYAEKGTQKEFVSRLSNGVNAVVQREALIAAQNRHAGGNLAQFAAKAGKQDKSQVRLMSFLGQERVLGCTDADSQDEVFALGHVVSPTDVHPQVHMDAKLYVEFVGAITAAATEHGFSVAHVEVLRNRLMKLMEEAQSNNELDEDQFRADALAAHKADRPAVIEQLREKEQQRIAVVQGAAGLVRPRFSARLTALDEAKQLNEKGQVGGLLVVAYIGQKDALAADRNVQTVLKEELVKSTPDLNAIARVIKMSEDTNTIDRLLLIHDGSACVAQRSSALHPHFGENQALLDLHGESCRTPCFEVPVEPEQWANVRIEVLGTLPGGKILLEADEIPPLVTMSGKQVTTQFGASVDVHAYQWEKHTRVPGFVLSVREAIAKVTFEQCGSSTPAQMMVEKHCMRNCDLACAKHATTAGRGNCGASCAEKCTGAYNVNQWQ